MTEFQPEGFILHTPENRACLSSLSALERAAAAGTILEETALMCDPELNLHFDLGGIRGVMPREECLLCRPGETFKDIAVITRVGKPVCFCVSHIRSDREGPVAVLSRRQAQRECLTRRLNDLIPGDLIRVRITHLESFGAFADVGCGIPALMPVDSLSVSRISHPRDRLVCGSCVWAAVRSADPQTGRIFLTMKELLGTWEENAARFSVGQTVAGIVRSVENYGVFIELAPNLAGLAEKRCDGPVPSPGDSAAVYIKSILPERMKVKLILIDSQPCTAAPGAPKYFTDPGAVSHIDRWVYSPDCCPRLVETVF